MHLLTAWSVSSRPVRVFSYGGGVQSNAVLVLQAQGKLPRPYDVFLFAHVGERAESAATLRYIQDHARPFAERHGIRLVEVAKTDRHGQPVDLYDYVMAAQRDFPLPLRMAHNAAPGNRSCTWRWKIQPVDRWIKAAGYTHATLGLGISLDEAARRMRDTDWHNGPGFQRRREYPLVELRLRRTDCHRVVTDAGLPDPPKSSCWFCPLRSRNHWTRLLRTNPAGFWRVVYLEQYTNARRAVLGRDALYFHPAARPLVQATPDQPLLLPELDGEQDACADALCFT
jgi:hypothetical protein